MELKKAVYTDSSCQTPSENGKGEIDHKGKYEWIAGGEAQCYPLAKGKYTDSDCLTTTGNKKGEPKGEYERTSPVTFTGKGGFGDPLVHANPNYCLNGSDESVREPRGKCAHYEEGSSWVGECSYKLSGEAVGLSGVTNVALELDCGATEFGTNIVLHGKGRLGYITKGEAGLLFEFEPSKPFSCTYEEAECEIGAGNATEGAYYLPESTGGYDGIIAHVGGANQMTENLELGYHSNTKGEETPSSFEGEHIDELEFARNPGNLSITEWSPFGLEGGLAAKLDSMAEIKG